MNMKMSMAWKVDAFNRVIEVYVQLNQIQFD